jgi:inorganic pyrophosphatase/exopolyphosphatase
MKNLVIKKQRTFNEDSCIRIAGKVEIDNVKHNFKLETDDYGVYVDGIDKQLVPQLVEAILEVDPDLDCFLEF